MEDGDFLQLFNEFSVFHSFPYKDIFEFDSKGKYIDYLRSLESLKGDKVKSYEECEIANYLYINDIDYEYEKAYEIDTATIEHSQYKPDFYLPKYKIYIEHFGINREGDTAPFVPKKHYQDQMAWKREIHNKNGTHLIETYSYEKNEGILLSNLKKKLEEKGVEFNPISDEEIVKRLKELKK